MNKVLHRVHFLKKITLLLLFPKINASPMKNITTYFFAFFVFCFTLISCQKIELKPSNANTLLLQKDANSVAPLGGFFFPVSAPYIPLDGDSIERLTTLGIKLTNPYLIPNMQQAYTNLGLSSSKAIIKNLCVRFLPSSTDQLAVLDSTMDAQGLELFDTPVDYIVTYEGDYYQDNGLSSHLSLLEDFSPFRTGDHFHWIPQGLFYDMTDARNDQTAVPRFVNLDDQVSGYYTNQKLFSAFSSNITTLGNYKTNLLLQNGNTQSAAVTTLFSQYGY